MSTPRSDGLAMPAEWAPHERTLMAWPRRRELWGPAIGRAKDEYAAVANAIAAHEPVTMVCADAADAAEARAALTGAATVVVMPIDDSWLRDSGPIVVRGPAGERAGVHFGFNAWGGKFSPWDRDAAVGALLCDELGLHRYEAPIVLEGGAVAVDGAGALITTEQCLLHPTRNPQLSKDEIEAALLEWLGVERVVWLGRGLHEDRDTDGHVDLIAAFTGPGEVLLQAEPDRSSPDHEAMIENRERLQAAGIVVRDLDVLPHVEVAGERAVASHMNFYVCNGAVIVPLADAGTDERALEVIGACFPGREAVGVPAAAIAFGGGGPHCITQQVPA